MARVSDGPGQPEFRHDQGVAGAHGGEVEAGSGAR